ncbi:hypothetical protein [Iamia sp.]|uniref:hypothetical protein n=1 Tax=Iamia sp. TaxID=2722710 RepID=UPI002BA47D7F|nr:hypothetical protein [Iamia sp.]HXH59233.1 hypothetical protein [Iamia sp.]
MVTSILAAVALSGCLPTQTDRGSPPRPRARSSAPSPSDAVGVLTDHETERDIGPPPRQPLWSSAPSDSYAVGVITRDAVDRYTLAPTETGVRVRGEASNVGGNTRLVFWRRGLPAVVDGETCATWSSQGGARVQQGAALRITRDGDALRAVTVTQNVYLSRYAFNVHTIDTSRAGAPYRVAGQIIMTDKFFAFGIPPLPWRFCARALDDTVTLKIWTDSEAEPSWFDPAHTGRVTLPDGWDHEGQFGWYAGHLDPGGHAEFSDMSNWFYDWVQRMVPRPTPATRPPPGRPGG